MEVTTVPGFQKARDPHKQLQLQWLLAGKSNPRGGGVDSADKAGAGTGQMVITSHRFRIKCP